MSTIDTEQAEPFEEGTPAEPASEGADLEEVPAPPEQDNNYLLHYRTREDAEKALREKDSYIGKLQSELNEVRQAVEQIQQTQQQYISPQDDELIEELIDEDPARAAVEALRRGDQYRLDRALEAWYDIEPRKAAKFERALELNQIQQAWQQQYQPLQQAQQQQQLAAAYYQARRELPDFDQYEPAMNKAAEEAPWLLEPLGSGDFEKQKGVIRTLYLMARGMGEQQAVQQVQAQAQAETPQVPYVAQSQTVPAISHAGPVDPVDERHNRVVENLRRRSEMWKNAIS